MRILYIGTDERLDWTRKQLLVSAGYVVLEARDQAQARRLAKDARIALVSNLLPTGEREKIADTLSSTAPDTLSMAFETPELSDGFGITLPRHLEPNDFLRSVGAALMQQHHHPEVKSPYFLYVDHRRRFTHVSDGVCELTGFSREEILGKPIEWLTYDDDGTVPAQFLDFLQSKQMSGGYKLRSKQGAPVQVRFEATVLSDGCLCSELTPEEAV